MKPIYSIIGIVGVGAMGQGIAQIAAQAGSFVKLFDLNPEAAQLAIKLIGAQWDKLLEKGRLDAQTVSSYKKRLSVSSALDDFADAQLVIEAIIENLDVKKKLFQQLESIVAPDAVLVSNTSSLSITAIAADSPRPQRIAGYHFFNPVPLMKVVEIIAGLQTDAKIANDLSEFARQMGHTPVRAQDTPGFIVNHAGRAYPTEALKIVSENVADFTTVDRILKDQIGFKLGPFELLDLTGLDVSHPVMEAIYQQYYDETRYRPNVITAQRLAGNVLGRKTKRGFYAYESKEIKGQKQLQALIEPEEDAPIIEVDQLPPVWVSSRAARRAELFQLLKDLGARIETNQSPSSDALCLVAPLGFDVSTSAVLERLDPARTIGIDLLVPDNLSKRRVLATNPATKAEIKRAAHALFARDGKSVSVIKDSGGFISQRVVAMIVNIASDICQQNICTPSDLDLAVTLGLGYPKGPLAMGDYFGADNILEVLFNLQTVYGDMRYRPSPWLRRRAAIGLSLLHPEN